MPIWTGPRKVAVIPVTPTGVAGAPVGNAPADFRAQVMRRIFYDPAPNTNLDRSLRKYIFSVSYGRAWLDADVLDTVTVHWEHPGADPNPSVGADVGKTMSNAIAASQPRVAGYDYVMVVFPPGIPNIRSWAFWGGGGQATSYVFHDNPLGAWAMELLHMVTQFGDLYGPPASRPLSPGNLDEMDTAGAMHPSTFTKLHMGWLDADSVKLVDPRQPSDHILHPLALLQPPPDDRVTALKLQIDRPDHYLLVEAREWLDEYDRNTPGLAEGIPIEGLAVYDVDETTWPPLWLRAQGLKRSNEYVSDDRRFKIKVGAHIAGGGFNVSVVPLPEPQRCAEIRQAIADAKSEIAALQADLHQPGANKAQIVRQIRELQRTITMLTGEGTSLHCTL